MTEPTLEQRLRGWEFASYFVEGDVDVIRHNLRRGLRQACVEIRRLLKEQEHLEDGRLEKDQVRDVVEAARPYLIAPRIRTKTERDRHNKLKAALAPFDGADDA